MTELPKIIAVLGPTASGKTDLGIFLAKKFNGEIVNFDSRQVYKKMKIGTAKPVGKWETGNFGECYMVDSVPHHMMDIVNPDKEYSVAEFKATAVKIINNILKRKKLPILVGGTGLYFWAVIDNLDIPSVKQNSTLRQSLEIKPLAELVTMLEKFDPESAVKIDLKNPRRVLRALEVFLSTGESFVAQTSKSNPLYDVLQMGIAWPRTELHDRINQRAENQMKDGLVEEVKMLVAEKYDWNLPSMSSIGYKQIGEYLQGRISLVEAIELLKIATRQYAKKQMTWFKRDQRIIWLSGRDQAVAEKKVIEFLN
ncbi:MAG: tRNA (adenosine(37)-N6)-dimethylallyltransferase MiaA [bacterium]|nr:tRNA (adenosine(37)-N6)-dimethylallyltransferase MiaA [bacterium]